MREENTRINDLVALAHDLDKRALSASGSFKRNPKKSEFLKSAIEFYENGAKTWKAAAEETQRELRKAVKIFKSGEPPHSDILIKRYEKKMNHYHECSEIDAKNIAKLNPDYNLRKYSGVGDFRIPLTAVLSLAFFVFALAFSSFSITGFATINQNSLLTVSYIALGCFVVGIIFAIIYLKKEKGKYLKSASKKKKKKKKSAKKKSSKKK